MAWAILRDDPAFQAMQSFMIERRSEVGWRQTLSAHMTQSCGPVHRAPIPSLKACGFNNLNFNSGLYQLNINFPHAFDENDEMPFSYSSGLYPKKDETQNSAAREITVAMVVAAPRSFRMCPSCFKGGADDIEAIKKFSESLHIDHPHHWVNACGAMWVKRDSSILLTAAERASEFSHRVQQGPLSDNTELPDDLKVLELFDTFFAST